MSVRFEIRPLGLWGRPATPVEQRRSWRTFRASWTSTIDLLKREVAYLDGQLIVAQVDADAGELRRDGMLRARARVGFPGVKVSFDSRHGALTYATDAYDDWQANVRAIALALESLRAVDRYGVTSSGEQYRGWTAIAAGAAEEAMTRAEAARVLADAAGVPVESLTSPDAVKAAYRAAARQHHPDVGGSREAFRLIAAARDVLVGGAS